MVSDLCTVLGFLALVVMKLLSSGLCCILPPYSIARGGMLAVFSDYLM